MRGDDGDVHVCFVASPILKTDVRMTIVRENMHVLLNRRWECARLRNEPGQAITEGVVSAHHGTTDLAQKSVASIYVTGARTLACRHAKSRLDLMKAHTFRLEHRQIHA